MHTVELSKFGQEDAKEYKSASEALKRLLPTIKTSLDRRVAFLGKYELLDRKKLPRELKDPYVQKAEEKINLAKTLLKKKMDAGMVAELTGLSREEVMSLKRKL